MNAITLRQLLGAWGRWQKGRQGTGYEKMLLLAGLWPVAFDFYVLRYRPGQGIPPHRDEIPGARHYRANFVVWRGEGGEFGCDEAIFAGKRWIVFRSDRSTHWVTPVTSGTRWVLSLGWLRRDA